MSNKIVLTIALSLILSLALSVIGQQDEPAPDRKGYLTRMEISDADKLKVFNTMWETVNTRYFDPTFNGHDWTTLKAIYEPLALAAKDKPALVEVLNRMLGELNTSHLAVSFAIGLSGSTLKQMFGPGIDYKKNDIVYGLGFSVTKIGDKTVVSTVDKTSSADSAGIKPGWLMEGCLDDVSNKVNGTSLIHTELSKCLFVNDAQEKKDITLYKTFYLRPGAVAVRTSRLIDKDIAYIKFDSFDNGAAKWLKKTISDYLSVKTAIIDLRGNSGGYFSELKDCLSLFFPPQTVIGTSIERDLDEKVLRVGSENRFQGKIYVLIDENTYSCGEIFAAAIQEQGRGIIAGQKSTGKVLAAVTKGLSNNLELYFAVRDYRTAKNTRLEGRGVAPDIEIPLTIDDFRLGRDVIFDTTLAKIRTAAEQ